MEKATFGAGCFWHVQAVFKSLKGVLSATAGYMGGKMKDPGYEDVCTGKTGHAELVQVTFDPSVISYEDLLHVFWKIHNPTELNRQGPDVGTQYRSVVFCHSPEQEHIAGASKDKLQRSGRYRGKIVTEISAASQFYPADEYHQDYLERRGVVYPGSLLRG